MKSRYLPPLLAVFALLVLVSLCAFSVSEDEFALRMRFGQVQEGPYAAGLHWSWPFEQVARVERRVVTTRLPGESFLSSEQQGLVVDIALSWQVRDPAAYLRAVSGDEAAAVARLADAVRAELKPLYAQQPLARLVAASGGGFTPQVLARLQRSADALGIRLVDARVQRLDPSDEVATVIYRSMQAAYAAEAKQVRAEATAEADRLRAEADRNRAEILATANRDAQRLRGEGDAQAAAVYARSYGANPEFAAFYRSLQAYRTALGREGDILVIEPEGDFYRYLHSAGRH